MTLNEKVDMVTGELCNQYGFYNRAIPRVGIPALTMADGPAGVRINNRAVNGGRATELPAPIALAATWDVTLASTYADIGGSEAFLSGHNVLMGPAVDVVRVPLAGRAFEAYGEDPFLTAQLAVPYIHAVQQHPVMSVIKHYNVYTQEKNRFSVDAWLDERTLQEIYTPAFEAAAHEGVAAAMCSFNRINGQYGCENAPLLTGVLKKQLGFTGFVMSDYGATQSTVPSALAGLDQEQPSGTFSGQNLEDAVQSGQVPLSVLEDKDRRILTSTFRFGLFDHPVAIGPLPQLEHGAQSRAIAEQAMVLLKNSGGLLPLPAGLKSIAVIGPDANDATTQGGGSAQVLPTYTVSPLQGIQQRAGVGVKVQFAPGSDPPGAAHSMSSQAAVPSSVLSPAGAPSGTQTATKGSYAQYWLNSNFQGTPDVTRVDPQVAVQMGFANFLGFTASPLPGLPSDFTNAHFSARWMATLTVPATGDYTLTLTSLGRGSVYLDGELIIDQSQQHELASLSTTLHLNAGEQHRLRADYVADIPASVGTSSSVAGGQAILTWIPPANAVSPSIQAAAALAKDSDIAVVFVRDYESEQYDRPSLSLPNDQDQLIAQVAAANPRTIVVIMTGQGVTMPWLASVPAVLQAWYPGQEQGNAIARVLFGDVNPSGKLPVTFPRSISDTVAADPSQYPGAGDELSLSEGVFVGYRGYDANGVEPLFPFGYGLSYTSFQYGGLQINNPVTAADGSTKPGTVSFTVTNTGSRSGAEVAQVYVGPLPANVPTPPKQLAGFTKVRLEPGASTQVTVVLNSRALSYWDVITHSWLIAAGKTPLYVGSSSRDVRLTGTIMATGQVPASAAVGSRAR
jgi:beta-glucosidase